MVNKVALKIRVKLADGKWHFLEPVFTPTGRLRPLVALVNGQLSNILKAVTTSDSVLWEPEVSDGPV